MYHAYVFIGVLGIKVILRGRRRRGKGRQGPGGEGTVSHHENLSLKPLMWHKNALKTHLQQSRISNIFHM